MKGLFNIITDKKTELEFLEEHISGDLSYITQELLDLYSNKNSNSKIRLKYYPKKDKVCLSMGNINYDIEFDFHRTRYELVYFNGTSKYVSFEDFKTKSDDVAYSKITHFQSNEILTEIIRNCYYEYITTRTELFLKNL